MLPTTMTKPLRLTQLRKTDMRCGARGALEDSEFMRLGGGSFHLVRKASFCARVFALPNLSKAGHFLTCSKQQSATPWSKDYDLNARRKASCNPPPQIRTRGPSAFR